MLDAKKLAKKLKEAMDGRTPPITGQQLAQACGVTAQAISGWRSTGRIAKRHLQTISDVTGQPLEFFLTDNISELSGKAVQKEQIKDRAGFRILLRAWQQATPDNREMMLKLATTILKLDGTQTKRRAV